MNTVILIGRLTKDGDYTVTNDDLSIWKCTLAVDREQTRKDGTTQADFPRVVVFGKQAENCHKYLSKGKKIAVRGRIQTGSYEANGQKYYTVDVVADRVEFLSPVEKGENPQHEFAQLNEEVPF